MSNVKNLAMLMLLPSVLAMPATHKKSAASVKTTEDIDESVHLLELKTKMPHADEMDDDDDNEPRPTARSTVREQYYGWQNVPLLDSNVEECKASHPDDWKMCNKCYRNAVRCIKKYQNDYYMNDCDNWRKEPQTCSAFEIHPSQCTALKEANPNDPWFQSAKFQLYCGCHIKYTSGAVPHMPNLFRLQIAYSRARENKWNDCYDYDGPSGN